MIAFVPTFSARDGTRLAYHVRGKGSPVVCLPGGPMQASAYLGDLGGLSGSRRLILLDPRGAGQSGTPTNTGSYRCDRLVDDVEALREHVSLDRIDLLAHSAGANLAVLYATRHSERVGKLVLVTPSTFAVGITATSEQRREVVRLREGKPWFPAASIAFEAIQAGQATEADWEAITPLTYGRWDAAARAHHESADKQRRGDRPPDRRPTAPRTPGPRAGHSAQGLGSRQGPRPPTSPKPVARSSIWTGYRSPRITGLPWQIDASVVIRSSRDMAPAYRRSVSGESTEEVIMRHTAASGVAEPIRGAATEVGEVEQALMQDDVGLAWLSGAAVGGFTDTNQPVRVAAARA